VTVDGVAVIEGFTPPVALGCVNKLWQLGHFSYMPGGGCSYIILVRDPICSSAAPFQSMQVWITQESDGYYLSLMVAEYPNLVLGIWKRKLGDLTSKPICTNICFTLTHDDLLPGTYATSLLGYDWANEDVTFDVCANPVESDPIGGQDIFLFVSDELDEMICPCCASVCGRVPLEIEATPINYPPFNPNNMQTLSWHIWDGDPDHIDASEWPSGYDPNTLLTLTHICDPLDEWFMGSCVWQLNFPYPPGGSKWGSGGDLFNAGLWAYDGTTAEPMDRFYARLADGISGFETPCNTNVGGYAMGDGIKYCCFSPNASWLKVGIYTGDPPEYVGWQPHIHPPVSCIDQAGGNSFEGLWNASPIWTYESYYEGCPASPLAYNGGAAIYTWDFEQGWHYFLCSGLDGCNREGVHLKLRAAE